ncbi:MAG: LamG domain-containing protein [Kiritimatiellia bacterium]
MTRAGKSIGAAILLAATGAAADVATFPAVPWSETSMAVAGKELDVVSRDGKLVLRMTTYPGAHARELVVSQAVDHLVIDARKAFAAGMTALVMKSDEFPSQPYENRFCTLLSEFEGARGSKIEQYFEGFGANGHYYQRHHIETTGAREKYALVSMVAEKLRSLHLRWDIKSLDKEDGVLRFYGAKYGTESELAPYSLESQAPELLFHATFDGTCDAAFAKGSGRPKTAEKLEYGDGVDGKAVRLTQQARSVLEYAAKGNLAQERGTVSLWFKREWQDDGFAPDGGEKWRMMFANSPCKGRRSGSGELQFWWWADKLRAEQSDLAGHYYCWTGYPPNDGWNHFAVTWNEKSVRFFLNGRENGNIDDDYSEMSSALRNHDLWKFNRQKFASFFVGCQAGRKQFDGLIDELKIYSAPLTDREIRTLYREHCGVVIAVRGMYALDDEPAVVEASAHVPKRLAGRKLEYCICDKRGKVVVATGVPVGSKAAKIKFRLRRGEYVLRATDGEELSGEAPIAVLPRGNPYLSEGKAADEVLKAPGAMSNLELQESIVLDHIPEAERFRAVGEVKIAKIGDRPYLEAGSGDGDRFALRFRLKANEPLWLFEIDYPDDKVRTADLIVQPSKMPYADYAMQVGYAAGDEYPNSGKMLTHRVMYWAKSADVTLVAMTARKNAPAAIGAVRVYRVKRSVLGAAKIAEPESGDGWGRIAAMYFEDPSIGTEFALKDSAGYSPEELNKLIDRTAAKMKFTGENLLAYPGAFYQGLIGASYHTRHHAPDFLSAWYAKFDKEGLFLMPTLNVNEMPVEEGLVTRESMVDGSLHDSVVAIQDDGRTNWGKWHSSPPNYNFHHKDVRQYVGHMIDALVEQGAAHPSFKGICLHLTRHCLLWFGNEKSGYNDYTVEAFAKENGIEIPEELKHGALRGKAYAKWLRDNHWDKWIDWRCKIVTGFYADIAGKLAARRSDLKLWMNFFECADVFDSRFTDRNYMAEAWRLAGLDAERLEKSIPNLILGQTMVPADYRVRSVRNLPKDVYDHLRVIDTKKEFYSEIAGCRYPAVLQFDRYWESAIGRSDKSASLSCDWLKECVWRVSTINPAGVHAMRHYVEPLRHQDVLGVAKGGFLIGTYGMEERLVPFLQAFRAMPAVRLRELGRKGEVVLRGDEYGGKYYFYIVNTDYREATVAVKLPPASKDLVTGEQCGDGNGATALRLAGYEMRSFVAPQGAPSLK